MINKHFSNISIKCMPDTSNTDKTNYYILKRKTALDF